MSKSGAFPFTYALTGGDSYIYAAYIDSSLTELLPGVENAPLIAAANGILDVGGAYATPSVVTYNQPCPSGDGSGNATEYGGWFIHLADWTEHYLPTSDISYSGSSCSSSFTDVVTDDTGYTVSVTGGTANSIYTGGGMSITGSSIVDSNGNSISQVYNNVSNTASYIDTLGVTVLTQTGNASGLPPQQSTWTNVNGSSVVFGAASTEYTLKSAFGCAGLTDYSSSLYMPSEFTFPDNTTIGLTYETTPGYSSDTTGRLAKLTLRSGGSVSYNWNPSGAVSSGHYGLNCTYLVPNSLTRTTSDGTTTYTWAPVNNGKGHWGNTTTLVDRGGNKTVYTFTGLTSTGNAAPPVTQALTEIQYYINIGTVSSASYSSIPTRQDVYCYNAGIGQPGDCATAVVSLPITEKDVYTTLAGMSNSSRTQTQYDKYGNVTFVGEYDFGATTPASRLVNAYGSWNGPGCSPIGNNINNKLCYSGVTDGALNNLSDRLFTYDPHGNLLKTQVTNGSAWLGNSTNNVYNSNGTPSVIYDLANNPTSIGYSSASYSGCGSCTNYPFATSVTKGGLTVSSTWNGVGGVKTQDTDANGNATLYGYQYCSQSINTKADPFWRVVSVTDPLGNTFCKTYPTGSSPDTITNAFSFNSGNSAQNVTQTTDGYGRLINTQKQQSPSSSNYDTVSTTYSSNGIPTNVYSYLPCTTTLGSTCSGGVVGSSFYDMLGRLISVQDTGGGVDAITYAQNDVHSSAGPAPSLENTKQTQNEYDGLGRLTSSCNISTTVSGYVSCGQNAGPYSGVLTTTSYTSAAGSQTMAVTRGSQTRTSIVDALGRLTKVTLPESGSTYYYYDGAPCGGTSQTFPGKLIGISYANGNSVCNWYDTLGRLIVSEAYNSSSTLCRRLIFDSTSKGIVSPPSGSSIANTAGRLVEAETDACTAGTITPITDEWFSYDKDGNITDMWELTPHSGTYYHSQATFAGNGAPLTVQLANPSFYTEAYGLDGEGRPATLTSGTQAIVSGTTFNAASQPTYIDLGTGTDRSSYVYDPLTGRMTNWTFQVGSSATETGALTWNANWSLRQLVINDGFNSGGSQTCTFGASSVMGYDDLSRLLSDNCGSAWAQTFSYDQYDNLTKAGSSTWNPGYNSTNNHYNIGSYDNSGNVLNDTFHTYTWDPFGKLFSIDSTACATNGECVTYDAFGRIVETSSAGAYTEIWYTQMGKGVYMRGSTPYYAYWPTPGGGTVEINGNNATAYYMHKDWLGNARISSTIANHTVVSDQAYAPYSEVYNKLATGAGVPAQMFTGDTQDILSGLFDTPNRELNASQGRWLSPDPAGAGWNPYVYAANNPLSFVDPLGLYINGPGECSIGAGDPCGGEGGGGGGGDDDDDSCMEASCGSDGVDPSSDCPICSGPWGAFGTSGIEFGWDAFLLNWDGALSGQFQDTSGFINEFTTPVYGNGNSDSPYILYDFVLEAMLSDWNFSLLSDGNGGNPANNGDSTVLDNRANALIAAMRGVPGLKKTTLAGDCLILGVGTTLGIPTSKTGAPSYGPAGTAYVKSGYSWAKKRAPALGEYLDEIIENTWVSDVMPLVPIVGTANTTVRCYNNNAAGGTNHP